MATAAPNLWMREAGAAQAEPAPALTSDTACDVCIVGGGFTGLWAAVALKQLDPACDVVLVESDICGAGASGRNGGFLLTLAAKYLTLEKMFGGDAAATIVAQGEANVDELARFCAGEGIDAEIRRDGWLWTASNGAQRDSWMPTLEGLARQGLEPFSEVAAEDIRFRTGSPRHLGGVFAPNAATLQPARLVRGLRRAALARGVRLHERTPMTRLERAGRPSVATPHGTVRAGKVILALNAWSGVVRELDRKMVVVGSDIVASEPMPEVMSARGLADGRAISDSRLFTHYYRTTPDGRLVFGKGGGAFAPRGRPGDLYEGRSPFEPLLRDTVRWFYPGFPADGFAESWSGPIDRSMSGLPLIGHLAGCPAILYGYGFSGNGVGPARLVGRTLASLALERDDELARSPLVGAPARSMPPEPLRYYGARLLKGALRRKELAEDEGRPPARLDVALAGLMPGGMVPVGRRKERGKT